MAPLSIRKYHYVPFSPRVAQVTLVQFPQVRGRGTAVPDSRHDPCDRPALAQPSIQHPITLTSWEDLFQSQANAPRQARRILREARTKGVAIRKAKVMAAWAFITGNDCTTTDQAVKCQRRYQGMQIRVPGIPFDDDHRP